MTDNYAELVKLGVTAFKNAREHINFECYNDALSSINEAESVFTALQTRVVELEEGKNANTAILIARHEEITRLNAKLSKTRDDWFQAYKIACNVPGISAPPFSRILRELNRGESDEQTK